MTPHYTDDWLTIYGGDCREVLASLPADSVDCVVTSPPYWGLRDYGTATWAGGDAECDHKNGPLASPKSTLQGYTGPDVKLATGGMPYRATCGKCGAVRIDSQLGLERTPEEYVANMVAVFAEVRRVLKPSGTCWLNLGDSYASNGSGGGGQNLAALADKWAPNKTPRNPNRDDRGEVPRPPTSTAGLKSKDLVGIPWRVAFALQADGWYLRSDIIWSKPNPMPESVTDRPTKSHEYLFLLTKAARYYFDADAVREPHRWQDPELLATNAQARQGYRLAERRAAGDVTAVRTQPMLGREKGRGKNGNAENEFSASPAGRNIRSVWNIATRPYPGAHFAVFPPELPERCIKAGSSERGVCPECGAPWERVVEQKVGGEYHLSPKDIDGQRARGGNGIESSRLHNQYFDYQRATTGWRDACRCTIADPVPAVVLDPFAGSGTVGMVANRLSRRAILIDLNPEYLKQQMKRNGQVPLGLGA